MHTGAYLESAADVKQLVIAVRDKKPVFMADIAKIEDGPDQPRRYVWHSTPEGRYPAVTLQPVSYTHLDVYKRQGLGRRNGWERALPRAP